MIQRIKEMQAVNLKFSVAGRALGAVIFLSLLGLASGVYHPVQPLIVMTAYLHGKLDRVDVYPYLHWGEFGGGPGQTFNL